MTTIVEFRLRRNEADAAHLRPAATAHATHAARDPFAAGADIILLPLHWLKQFGSNTPRKPLKRRFALTDVTPA